MKKITILFNRLNYINGAANRVTDSNGAVVIGAGNTVKNSRENIFEITNLLNNADFESVSELQNKFIEGIRQTESGGSTLVIGGGNEAEYTLASQITGVNNKLTGSQRNISTYNLLNGYKNTGKNVEHISVIGSENTISDATANIIIGDRHTLEGTSTEKASNNVILGSMDATVTHTASLKDTVMIGHNADAKESGAVALGSSSVASRTKENGGVGAGYDVTTKTYYNGSDKSSSTWTSTLAAVSVGGDSSDAAIGQAADQTRQITGVAAGTADTDAVNVAQLKLLADKINDIGTGTGKEYTAESEVIGASSATEVKSGSASFSVSEKDAASPLASLTIKAGENIAITNENGVAVINAITADVDGEMKYGGDINNTEGNQPAAVKLNNTVNVVGGAANADDLTEGNIGVVASQEGDNAKLTVKLNKDINLGDKGSVTIGETKVENNNITVGSRDSRTIITGDTITTNTANAGDTTINNNGLTIKNGGDKGQSIVINKGNVSMGGNQIHNVAAGTADTDAVNVSQLKQSEASFNQSIHHLNGRIGEVAQDANAGIAMALAAASLPQVYLPGKSMMAVAGGTYRGESGYAIGFSTISDDGKWIIKANAAGNSQGHYGAAIGAGYMW